RRRHTRVVSDWSSDVCSSDLLVGVDADGARVLHDVAAHVDGGRHVAEALLLDGAQVALADLRAVGDVAELDAARLADLAQRRARSEERRVGKGGRSEGSPDAE